LISHWKITSRAGRYAHEKREELDELHFFGRTSLADRPDRWARRASRESIFWLQLRLV
jgi:hypothetical protein